MGASFRRELILGILSAILFTVFIVVHTIQYQNRKVGLLVPTAPSIANQTPTVSGGPTQATQRLTSDLVAKHNNATDCWIIVQNKVYSASSYLNQHPGGADRIIPYCGQEATQAFTTMGGRGSHSQNAYDILGSYYIGELNGAATQQQKTTVVSPVQKAPVRSGGSGRSDEDD
jgi:cytochrome b involved in lipid metabolism